MKTLKFFLSILLSLTAFTCIARADGKANHPGEIIVSIDKEHYGYDIELSNSLDLKFNKQGQFISYDD